MRQGEAASPGLSRRPAPGADEPAGSICARGGAGGIRQKDVFRSLAVGLRAGACSTCHEPARGFGYGKIDPVVMGAGHGPAGRARRSKPPLSAGHTAIHRALFESEDEADESIDNGPTGGLTWDGRVDGGAEQAKIPLLAPNEMANRDAGDVAKSLAAASYASESKAVFGSDIFGKPEDALEAAVKSLAAFEQTPDLFYPYSSRYDAYLAARRI